MSEEKSGTVAHLAEHAAFTREVEGAIPSGSTKTWKCDICEEEFTNLGKYAGHRSGHVRRGELQKALPDVKSSGICRICNVYIGAQKLGGHMRLHTVPFCDLKGNQSQRHRLIWELGTVCEVCKQTTWMGKPIPIEIDHVDGNSTNNTRENLRLICPNCHAQTSTYKGRNIGKNPDVQRAKTLKKYYGKYR